MKFNELDPIASENIDETFYAYVWKEGQSASEGKTLLETVIDKKISSTSKRLTCNIGTGELIETFAELNTFLNNNLHITEVVATVTTDFVIDNVVLSGLNYLFINFGDKKATASSFLIINRINNVNITSSENLGATGFPLSLSVNEVGVFKSSSISIGETLIFDKVSNVEISDLLYSAVDTNIQFKNVSNANIDCHGNKTISLALINSNVYINDLNVLGVDRTEISSISMTKLSMLAIDDTITVVPVGWESSKTIQDGSNYGQYYKGV